MNKLIICDLDGTLFDTSMVNYHSYQKALQEFGFNGCDFEYFSTCCNGKHYSTFLPELSSDDKDILDQIHMKKKHYYFSFLHMAKENKQLFSILKSMKAEYKISLVTTASKENTYDILSFFKKIDFFDLIVTIDDVHFPKPSPEGFIKAMEFFNISSENTIIFEDSFVGLEAAYQTNANIFKVETFR